MRYDARPEDIEKLKAVASAIEQALEGLTRVEALRTEVAARIGAEAAGLERDFQTLEILSDEAVSDYNVRLARMRSRQDWFNTSPPLLRAIAEAEARIWEAKPLLAALAQERSVREGTIALTLWAVPLMALPEQDLFNQLRTLRSTAKEVLGHVVTVLAGKVGQTLSREERAARRLLNGVGGWARELTTEELLAGEAFE